MSPMVKLPLTMEHALLGLVRQRLHAPELEDPRVALERVNRTQQARERQDRHPGAARKRGEKCADESRGDGGSAADVTGESVEHGDEVMVPSLSFVATANAVAHAGAVPHFIDSEYATLGMSPDKLRERLSQMKREGGKVYNPETGARIAAISPMHALGHPVRIKEIVAIADEYGIPVVEDAAESLGSYVDGQHTGTFGLTGMISFNGNKIVTTGGGGVILTNDDAIGKRAKHITTTAKLPHKWEFEHDELAWNYRMTNLTAALGIAQLEKLEGFKAEKRVLAERYAAAFEGFEGAKFVAEPAGTTSNYWLCAVQLDEPSLEQRDALLQACHDDGILARPMWNLLHKQRMYNTAPAADLEVATALHASLICLPSTPRLARR